MVGMSITHLRLGKKLASWRSMALNQSPLLSSLGTKYSDASHSLWIFPDIAVLVVSGDIDNESFSFSSLLRGCVRMYRLTSDSSLDETWDYRQIQDQPSLNREVKDHVVRRLYRKFASAIGGQAWVGNHLCATRVKINSSSNLLSFH